MKSIAIELKLECRSCGNNIPLNGLSAAYTCKSCLSALEIAPKKLGNVLNEVIDRVMRENDNRLYLTGNLIPYYFEGMHCLRLYGPEQPQVKGEKLNAENLAEDAAKGFAELGGTKLQVRKTPAAFENILTQVAYLVGEDEEITAVVPPEKATPAPVLFSCLSCGGALSIDGSTRIVNCSYCGNQSFLPDALWLKFHPVSRVKRWYMILK